MIFFFFLTCRYVLYFYLNTTHYIRILYTIYLYFISKRTYVRNNKFIQNNIHIIVANGQLYRFRPYYSIKTFRFFNAYNIIVLQVNIGHYILYKNNCAFVISMLYTYWSIIYYPCEIHTNLWKWAKTKIHPLNTIFYCILYVL